MVIKNNIKNLSKLALIAFGAATIGLSSCHKDKTTPLNEQFQYDLTPAEQVAIIPSSYSSPSISFTDFDGNGNTDLVVSNKSTGHLHVANRLSDGSFGELSENIWAAFDGIHTVTDVASKRVNGPSGYIKNFVVLSDNNLYLQEYDNNDGSATVTSHSEPISFVPYTAKNNGMVSAFDFNNDGHLDLLVARTNSDNKLMSVYVSLNRAYPDGSSMSTVFDYNTVPLFSLPEGTKSFDVYDLNKDGRPDVMIMDKNNVVTRNDMIKHYPGYE